MSFEVILKPSNSKFYCESNESVLDAALRSGINLSYHCATGSCGECRAKVLDGEVSVHRHYDFVIPEADKIANTVLLCSVTAKSDLVIYANEAKQAKDIPFQEVSVKVAKIEQPNENNIVIHLRTPRSRTLRFLAGQYVQAKIPGVESSYQYIASCPCNGMIIQLHVARSEHPFSQRVFGGLKVGDVVELSGPSGDFTLDEESGRPIVMVAQDTGFAPIKSLIEHAIALDLPQSMYLFWLVEQGQDHYQSNYCRSWEDALDCFIYRPLHLDKLSSGANDYKNAFDYVRDRSPVDSEIDLYLVGQQAMLDEFSRSFVEKGTPLSRIHAAHSLGGEEE
jgi:CDP-4-dehydro-6-deoxyglucose reductase